MKTLHNIWDLEQLSNQKLKGDCISIRFNIDIRKHN